jgi:hypothetical protein
VEVEDVVVVAVTVGSVAVSVVMEN